MIRSLGLMGALLLASAAAASQGDAGPKQKQDHDAVECRYQTVLNSKIPQKICRTKFEWKQEQEAQLEERRSSRAAASRCGDGSPC